MHTLTAARKHFIGYPTNRVVGAVADAAKAEEGISALLKAGFRREDIDVLHGDDAVHRLDLTGEEHGFLARVQRTVISRFELEEFKHLSDHLDDIRAGRFVIMVLTKRRDRRILAADILHQHGAVVVGFYGRWAWVDLPSSGQMSPADIAALFTRAWNARDADALAALFDEDAEFVNEAGLLHDRESIRRAHVSRLQRVAGAGMLATEEPNVKLLSPEVAVVYARMTLSGETAADAVTLSPAPRTTIVSFVVHRAGDRWLCASAHNTALVPEQTDVSDHPGVKV